MFWWERAETHGGDQGTVTSIPSVFFTALHRPARDQETRAGRRHQPLATEELFFGLRHWLVKSTELLLVSTRSALRDMDRCTSVDACGAAAADSPVVLLIIAPCEKATPSTN